MVVRFLSYLAATWCGFALLVLGTVCAVYSSIGDKAFWTFLNSTDVHELIRELSPRLLLCFFTFVLGVAFGRFLLRAMPPPVFGWAKRRQIAIIAVCLAIAVIGFFILTAFVWALPALSKDEQTTRPPGATRTSDAVALALAGSAVCTILWATGAVGPALLRHRRPEAFLERPFVLFLRRFSTFSDRTIIALVLSQVKAGVPVVFLTPTHSRPKDWDPFIVGFAGLKLLHPLRSVPIIIRAPDDDWQRAAQELISRAQTIIADTSEGSAALGSEAEMIEKAGRWPDTVCLRQTSPAGGSGQDSRGAFGNARCIGYSKSWTRALPRLAISLPIVFNAAFLTLAIPFLPLVVIPFSYSILWRPAVSRNAKIELRRVLRAESQSENERPDSITVIAWIMLARGGGSFLLTSIFTINSAALSEMIAKNPIPAPVWYLMIFADPIIYIVSAIFILRGANWARLLYICWGAFYFVIVLLTWPDKGATLTIGIPYLIVVFFLLRPRASAYFAWHNRVKTS